MTTMTMSQKPPPEADFDELLGTDRELNPAERTKLMDLGKRGWFQVMELLAQRAKATYSTAESRVFTRCVQMHMNEAEREKMMTAEVFTCPQCSTLLKDRKSAVASSILMERKRLAQLWLDVEQAPFEAFDDALDRFRAALGLVR